MDVSWDQGLSLVGAFLILLAYALQTLAPDKSTPQIYQTLNLFGALGLTITAVVNRQFGFIILEGAWALISAFSLGRLLIQAR